MNPFDLVEVDDLDLNPSWLLNVSESERRIFSVAKIRFNKIIACLNTSKTILPIRQRKLVRTSVCVEAGLSEKYLHKNKHPQLYAWIETANGVLEQIALDRNSKFSHKMQNGKLRRDDLIAKVDTLEREAKEFRAMSISTICRQLIDSQLLATHSEITDSLRRVEGELKLALERESNAEKRAQRWHSAYSALKSKSISLAMDLASANGQAPNTVVALLGEDDI